ncbi:MAG: hypothetical protein KDC79_08920 [Cyclobacteriaceae bacterium]|nr:hypothetical protein [Cyclobacteriaceae bacterium]
MSNLEEIKEKKRKELIATLEQKKKELQSHFDEGANKAIEYGKGMIVIGTGVLLLYTVLDRYLESKFRTSSKKPDAPASETKASMNKLLLPLFTILLQQGASSLFSMSQKKLVDYLKLKKEKNERLQKGIPTK